MLKKMHVALHAFSSFFSVTLAAHARRGLIIVIIIIIYTGSEIIGIYKAVGGARRLPPINNVTRNAYTRFYVPYMDIRPGTFIDTLPMNGI